MVLALAGDSTMTSGRRPPRGRGPPGAPLPAWVSRDVSVRLVVAMAVAKGERWGELLSTPQTGHQGLKAPVTCGFSHVRIPCPPQRPGRGRGPRWPAVRRPSTRSSAWRRRRLGDVDLSAVWVIEPEEVINENILVRRAEEEQAHPLFRHLDRLATVPY